MKPLRLQIIVFTLTRIVLNTAHRMVYPFLPVFARGLGVDLVVISQAVAARSLIGATGPFLASIADSGGRKLGILIGLSVFSLSAFLVVGWPIFPVFVLVLILTVLGKYIFDPSLQAYLGEHIPYKQRGTVLALIEIGWSLSFMLGVPLMGFLIARYGWQAPYTLLGFLGLVSLIGLAWLLPKDPARNGKDTGLRRNLGAVLTSLPGLSGLIMGLLLSIANEVINLVFGVWMEDSFGLKIAALGAASAVIGFSELGGEGLTAALVDRIGKTRAVTIGLIVNCAAALALPLVGRSVPGALAGLFFFYLSFEFTIVSSIPIMSEVVPSARATLMASYGAALSLGRTGGALLATPLYRLGFGWSCLAAVAFNLLALVALNRLRHGLRENEVVVRLPNQE